MKAISLFTGAGGLDLGCEAAGFLTTAAVENDPTMRETLEANRERWFPSLSAAAVFNDIVSLEPAELLEASNLEAEDCDLVHGGPRSPRLVARKKAAALAANGRLACEGCGFDFAARYGERGEGFIECHHTVPLRDLRPGTSTRLDALALICSNCHRMIHRRSPWLTMEELRRLIRVEHPRPEGSGD